MKKRKSPERDIHRAVVDQLNVRAKPGVLWLHVPNAPRNAIAGRNLQRLGMLKGAADLLFFHNHEFFALELKAANGRTSLEQEAFRDRFKSAGGYAWVAFGVDEAIATLTAWGLLR